MLGNTFLLPSQLDCLSFHHSFYIVPCKKEKQLLEMFALVAKNILASMPPGVLHHRRIANHCPMTFSLQQARHEDKKKIWE